MELDRYDIDVAALSETRLADSGQLKEDTSGYTFYWSGLPATEHRIHGVGFAIRSTIVKKLSSLPKAINERLMMVRTAISKGRYATIISAYAPSMTNDDATKEKFYSDLDMLLRQTPKEDKIILIGDFNARVGTDKPAWPGTLGQHGVGKMNENGLLLLSKCKEHDLTITNTLFQLPLAQKTTWMHPRSKHWHLIDYVIVRRRDIRDVVITRVMRGAECQTDHMMLRCKLKMSIKPFARKTNAQTVRKLNVAPLKTTAVKEELAEKIEVALANNPSDPTWTVTEEWNALRDSIYNASKSVLGVNSKKQPDWFAENAAFILPLINAKNDAFKAWLGSNTRSTKARLRNCQQRLQQETRQMKDKWLARKAQEIQQFADANNTKGFYDAVKEVYGPATRGGAPLLSSDGTKLLTDRNDILSRWEEHFRDLLNRPSEVDPSSIENIEQQPTIEHLADEPTIDEIYKAIKLLSNGKAPGNDGIPAEVLKYGGYGLVERLHTLYSRIWRDEEVPQQLKDAVIVTIYKKKGQRSECGNHRGISLLSLCGKVLAKILQLRLVREVLEHSGNVSESQCGFRSCRSTTDMIFCARQLQEKCIEQNMGLYAVFIDLTKAFDTVSREALWEILLKLGCPSKFVNVLRQLHDGMQARVAIDGEFSNAFPIRNGVKQGCVVAPILFVIFFAQMLKEALSSTEEGIYIRFRTDGGAFNLQRLKAKTKVKDQLYRDLLFADDCGMFSHTEQGLQTLMNAFAKASANFSLTISTKKTEVLYQPPPGAKHHPPSISVNGEMLKVAHNFTYLGSVLSDDGQLDLEVANRISRASSSFGRLRCRVWSNHDITLTTKIALYRAVVISTLLYGAESWTTYKRHLSKLEAFHQRCLRNILKVKWEDKVSNTEILAKTSCSSIEALVRKRQLQWAGHVIRMDSARLPKAVFYGELKEGRRQLGKPRKRYKDSLAETLTKCHIRKDTFERTATDRPQWRRSVGHGIAKFEEKRVRAAEEKRLRRKDPARAAATDFTCPTCRRPCAGKVGLVAHSRVHRGRR